MDSERIVRDRWERASGASHILRLDLFEVHAVKGDPFLDIQMFEMITKRFITIVGGIFILYYKMINLRCLRSLLQLKMFAYPIEF